MSVHPVSINQFYLGAILGFVSSIPVGPIALTLIALTLRAEIQRAAAMAATVAVVDGCYAFVAASALSMPHLSMPWLRYGSLCGALAIIGYGVYLILSDKGVFVAAEPARLALSHRDLSLGALTGVVLYVSNPTIILFWLSAAAALRPWFPAAAGGKHWLFGAGVVLGTATWFGLLMYVIRHSSALASPTLVRRLSMIASWLLIGFGGYVLITSVERMR